MDVGYRTKSVILIWTSWWFSLAVKWWSSPFISFILYTLFRCDGPVISTPFLFTSPHMTLRYIHLHLSIYISTHLTPPPPSSSLWWRCSVFSVQSPYFNIVPLVCWCMHNSKCWFVMPSVPLPPLTAASKETPNLQSVTAPCSCRCGSRHPLLFIKQLQLHCTFLKHPAALQRQSEDEREIMRQIKAGEEMGPRFVCTLHLCWCFSSGGAIRQSLLWFQFAWVHAHQSVSAEGVSTSQTLADLSSIALYVKHSTQQKIELHVLYIHSIYSTCNSLYVVCYCSSWFAALLGKLEPPLIL